VIDAVGKPHAGRVGNTGTSDPMTQTFSCPECYITWHDEYTFWHGYTSTCPNCGRECQATIDDSSSLSDFCSGDPLFEDVDRAEEDIEAEGDAIHDEIPEALGAAEADASGDADGEGAGGEE
jgi:hypothetical protein